MDLDIEGIKNGSGGDKVRGNALVRSLEVGTTKNNTNFIKGFLSTSEGSVAYKIWAGSLQEDWQAKADEIIGTVVDVTGKVDEFRGAKSLTVDLAEKTEKDPAGYHQTKYSVEDNRVEFLTFMQNHLTEDGAKIFAGLMEKVADTFFTEFASITIHHDNVLGGLTAHSKKCVMVLDAIMPFYPNIRGRVMDKDLVYIGTALHDIGKAIEYKSGNISPVGRLLSHRTLATEMAARMKKNIVSLKGEEWYYRLLSIFEQHHGEYEETPRTIEAYLVHKVDMLESSVTDIDQAVEADTQKSGFRLHGFNLS